MTNDPAPATKPKFVYLIVCFVFLLMLVTALIAQVPSFIGWLETKESGIAQSLADSEFIKFCGRFHPMILHFPVALLTILLLFEVIAFFRTSKGFEAAMWILLILGWLSAVKASIFGVFLSWSGGYDSETLYWHKWLGIAVAILSTILVVPKLMYGIKKKKKFLHTYRVLLVGCAVLISFAGHYGANLTHGSNYLTEYMPDSIANLLGIEKGASKTVVASSGDFANNVWPILESQCLQCHGAEKQKGDFRVDSLEALLFGGESMTPGVVKGDAMASELIRRVLLPIEHDEVMPPEGKGVMTPEDIMTLVNWVNRGAQWAEGTSVAEAVEETEVTVTQKPRVEIELPEVVDFDVHIMPILQERCIECHGPEKQKGKLRVDSLAWIAKGSRGDPVVISGNPDESSFYTLTILPEDDPDIMPAKGDPLTKAQQALIYRWIEQGVDFPAEEPVEQIQPEKEQSHKSEPAASSLAAVAFGSGPKNSISYEKDIEPILRQNCTRCHGINRQESGLRLDSLEWIAKGADGAPVIISGKPEESELVYLINLSPDNERFMPYKNEPLSRMEIELIEEWIRQGVKLPKVDPTEVTLTGDKIDFKRDIMPIMNKHCVECHGTVKQKGQVRVDSLEWIAKGADGEPIAISGRPQDSKLYTLTILPADHPDVMPAKGDTLSKAETELLRKWLLQGEKMLEVEVQKPEVADPALSRPLIHFANQVQPIFNQSCVECHGPDKQYSQLRLDSLEQLNKGANGNSVVVAGDDKASKLYDLISLPFAHDDFMPAQGDPLTDEETELVRSWIVQGAGDGVPIHFASQIQPIFNQTCVHCHGPEKQKGQLRLDSFEWLSKGAGGKEVVVAGNPEKSLLYKLVTLPFEHVDFMPARGEKLPQEQADLLRDWIVQGARQVDSNQVSKH